MKIHIAHVLYSFGIGGLEGMLAGLMDRMDEGTYSHSLCVFHDDLASLRKMRRAKDINVHVIERRFPNDPTTIFRLARVLKKIAPDIVGTYNWGGIEGVIAARLSGVKVIVHSEHGFEIEEIFRPKERRVFIRRFLLKYCNSVIAVSKGLQRWLLEAVKVDKGKVVYIPNGCETDRFCPGEETKLKESMGIKKDEIIVGAVGTLKKLKGQDILIRAFARVAKSQEGLKLVLIGDGPQKKDLVDLAEKLNIEKKVIFTDRITETAPYYRIMDIFALPSLYENFPIALLESMATALPIIATDVGDVGFMLNHGSGGIIVKPQDIDEMSRGIEFFLGNPQTAIEKGDFARKRVESAFDIARMKETYEALYTSLMEQRSKG